MSENKELTVQPEHAGRTGILINVILFIMIAGAFAFAYFQLTQNNISLQRLVGDLTQQVTETQKNLAALQQTMHGNAEQTQVISNWIANRQDDVSRVHIIEALSLTKLAVDQLQLNRDARKAYILLKHAQELLQQVPNPAIEPLRQSLTANLDSLNEAQQLNINEVHSHVIALTYQVDKLPLPPMPLQYAQDEQAKEKIADDAPWWKKQWHKTMSALKKIVIVRYTGSNDMPLVLPEEKRFLYQNIQAQLQEISLALLNHQSAMFNAGVYRLQTWIKKYFVQDAAETQNFLNELNMLSQVKNIEPPHVDMSATINLFDQYLAQNNSPPAPPVQ